MTCVGIERIERLRNVAEDSSNQQMGSSHRHIKELVFETPATKTFLNGTVWWVTQTSVHRTWITTNSFLSFGFRSF